MKDSKLYDSLLFHGIQLSAMVWLLSAVTVSASVTTTTAFWGGDIGEGLDLSGTYVYAVNLGLDQADLSVQGLTFKSATAAGSTPGDVTVGAVNYAGPWEGPRDYGSRDPGGTSNDLNLEYIMDNSLLDWHGGALATMPEQTITFTAKVTAGQDYRLQLFFQEPAGDRFFDITVEGIVIADEFHTSEAASDYNTKGYVVTHDFTSTDTVLNVKLTGGSSELPDPFIQAFTLQSIPEPSTYTLLGSLLVLGCVIVRRRC